MTNVVVAPAARLQARRIDEWWREHRTKAPDLFSEELGATIRAIVTGPRGGQRYRESGDVLVKRVLMEGTRHHVYFSYDAERDLVEIRAVWHASRGRGPRL